MRKRLKNMSLYADFHDEPCLEPIEEKNIKILSPVISHSHAGAGERCEEEEGAAERS